MNILMWLNDFSLAGTPKAAQVFANLLSERGHKICITTYGDADTSRLINLSRKVSFNVIDRNNKHEYLTSLISDFKPNIIHAFLSGYREFPDPGVDFPRSIKFLMHSVFGHYNDNADYVVYMSEYLMNHTAKGDHKSFFIHNPTLIPCTKDDDRNLIGAENKIVLTRSGRPENGIYTGLSVKALDKFLHKYPLYRDRIIFYVLAPPPNMIKDLKKYAIDFYVKEPTVDEYEISRFYNTSDIHCHDRGDGESGGSCIMEAMIHGKAVITHVAQVCEAHPYPFQNQCAIIHDAYNGFVTDGSVESYTDALEKAILQEQLRKDLGIEGKNYAMANFEAVKCVDKLERIYKEIIANGRHL